MYKFLSLFLVFLINTSVFANEIRPISADILKKLTENYPVSNLSHCADIEKGLVEISINFYGVDNKAHTDGLIIVHKSVAPRVLKIFNELLNLQFNVLGVYPFKGLAIENNAFTIEDDYNYSVSYACRSIVGSKHHSKHSFGMAIDLNPLFNPYVKTNANKTKTIVPKNGEFFVDKLTNKPNKADKIGVINPKVVKIFKQNGFTTWGGNWRNPIDSHHFEFGDALAELLVAMKDNDGEKMFELHVRYFNKTNKDIVKLMLTNFEVKSAKELIEIYKINHRKFLNKVRFITSM